MGRMILLVLFGGLIMTVSKRVVDVQLTESEVVRIDNSDLNLATDISAPEKDVVSQKFVGRAAVGVPQAEIVFSPSPTSTQDKNAQSVNLPGKPQTEIQKSEQVQTESVQGEKEMSLANMDKTEPVESAEAQIKVVAGDAPTKAVGFDKDLSEPEMWPGLPSD